MGINPRNLQIRPGHGLVAGFFATSLSCAAVFFGGIITKSIIDFNLNIPTLANTARIWK